jgi:hypothetical protein
MTESIRKQTEGKEYLKPFADYIIDKLIGIPELQEHIKTRTLQQCFDFVKDKAREFAVNRVAMIHENEVYGWIREFYEISDLKVAEAKPNPKPVSRPEVKPAPKPEPKKIERQQTIFDLLGVEV